MVSMKRSTTVAVFALRMSNVPPSSRNEELEGGTLYAYATQLLLARLADHLQIAHANVTGFFCFLSLVFFTRFGTLARLALRLHCPGDRDFMADMLREID